MRNLEFCLNLKDTMVENQKILKAQYKQFKENYKEQANTKANTSDTCLIEEFHNLESDTCENLNLNNRKRKTSKRNQSFNVIPDNTKTTEDNKVICPKCGFLVKPRNLQQHIDIVHLKIKNYICDICCKSFYDKGRLKGHLMVNTNWIIDALKFNFY